MKKTVLFAMFLLLVSGSFAWMYNSVGNPIYSGTISTTTTGVTHADVSIDYPDVTAESMGTLIAETDTVSLTLQDVFGVDMMNAAAVNEIAKVSARVAQSVEIETNVKHVSGFASSIETSVTYSGTRPALDFTLVYEIPASFSENAGDITVNAPGATVKIIEDGPTTFAITYNKITPGQSMDLNFEVNEYINRNYARTFLKKNRPAVLATGLVEREDEIERPSGTGKNIKEEQIEKVNDSVKQPIENPPIPTKEYMQPPDLPPAGLGAGVIILTVIMIIVIIGIAYFFEKGDRRKRMDSRKKEGKEVSA